MLGRLSRLLDQIRSQITVLSYGKGKSFIFLLRQQGENIKSVALGHLPLLQVACVYNELIDLAE